VSDKVKATFQGETPAQQRDRILRQHFPRVLPYVYDDLYSLGYDPESWDGMWRIPASVEFPVLWLTMRWALVCEVVTEPGSYRARLTRRNRVRKRWVLRRVVR
jgi:hypothetical protein